MNPFIKFRSGKHIAQLLNATHLLVTLSTFYIAYHVDKLCIKIRCKIRLLVKCNLILHLTSNESTDQKLLPSASSNTHKQFDKQAKAVVPKNLYFLPSRTTLRQLKRLRQPKNRSAEKLLQKLHEKFYFEFIKASVR